MNILYICPRLPYPTDQGDKVVIYNQIKFLSKRHKITLLAMIENGKEPAGLEHLGAYCARIEVFQRRPNFSVMNFVVACFKTAPFTVIRYYSRGMLRRSKELIESGEFDIVHVAFYYMSQYAINEKISVPDKTATILDTHNIDYLIHSRFISLTKNLLIKFFTALEALRIKRYELSVYKRFDRTIAFSELDKSNIIRLSGAENIKINPTCIDLNTAVPGTNNPEEKNSLVFFGRLNTFANDDAIRFFYENIFPSVKARVPDAKLVIVGKLPSRYAKALIKDPNVRLAGLVPDMREYLKGMSLVVVPLRLGGGTRIKILEAWAAGKAVISTSIGMEGVEGTNGVDVVIADSVSDFSMKTAELLNDSSKRKAMGEAAFQKVREYYNPDRVINNLEAIYQQAIKEKNSRQ